MVPDDVKLLAWSTLFTWLLLMSASLIRAKAWTPSGLITAFGNRDDVPAAQDWVARLERASKNQVEGFILFAALVSAANLVHLPGTQHITGAQIWFYSRFVYTAVYVAGIPYLRTAVWLVGVAGLFMIGGEVVL